jgi:hypothetical protein
LADCQPLPAAQRCSPTPRFLRLAARRLGQTSGAPNPLVQAEAVK